MTTAPENDFIVDLLQAYATQQDVTIAAAAASLKTVVDPQIVDDALARLKEPAPHVTAQYRPSTAS